MTIKKIIPNTILLFVKFYLASILIFSVFRVILFFSEIDRIDSNVSYSEIFSAFIMGLRFDVVISGYILILPYVIAAIGSFFNKQSIVITKFIKYYIFILFSIAFLVCAVDLPYFNQFSSRFSISAFIWADSPSFVFKMIIEEPRYWMCLIPFIIIVFFFYKIVNKLFVNNSSNFTQNKYYKIILSLVFLLFILIGIRGRLDEKSPIRVGTAFFSNNPFLNQLGLNPNFTLIRSYLDSKDAENKKIQLMDNATAISNVQKYLNIEVPNKSLPLYRDIVSDTVNTNKPNVVLVIMESMSAAKMTRHGNTNNLTPFLDSISNKGYYFENTYTSGIHTYNGIFSTLFSYPALFRQHPMKVNTLSKHYGAFSALKENGYSTIYFTTHDGQFDNVEGYLKSNDCETFISKSDYPSDQVKTTLGVPDDYMFEFSIPILNKLNQKNKPFFSVFMTASDHGPYYVPDYFKPKNTDIKKQIVEYADFSLSKLIKLSSKQKWFKNTIFVFVADHGASMDDKYNMSLNYNHSPLIFYAPYLFKENKVISDIAGQIDVFPTIMGLLKINYGNNTLGIDLFREKRPYIFFNADDKYGVIDDEWFLIVNNDKSLGLYKYRNSDTFDYSKKMPEIVEKMNTYAKSNLQSFQYVLTNNK